MNEIKRSGHDAALEKLRELVGSALDGIRDEVGSTPPLLAVRLNEKAARGLWGQLYDLPVSEFDALDEQTKRLVSAGLHSQFLKPGAYEKLLTKGEGTIPPQDAQSIGVMEGTFQWVRVYRGNDTTKAIGTFYLYYTLDAPDVVEEMWLTRVFKGKPPSPVEKHTSSFYFWARAVELYNAGELLESPGDAEQRSTEILKDEMGSQGARGLRATTRVGWEERPNFDHVWVLDGYRVRSTKLAPVLHTFRRAGIQRIPVDMIRRAVQAL